MSAVLAERPALRPVLTVADEPLIRFVISSGPNDDTGLPEFDEFDVDRKSAAFILRNHRKARSYIERRKCEVGSYEWRTFGNFYCEPRSAYE